MAVSDLEMLQRYATLRGTQRDFAPSHLPGKITLILPSVLTDIATSVLGPDQTVGIRIPDHLFVIELVKRLDFPITSTSVNRTGEKPLNDPHAIAELFGMEVDLIIDAGILPPSAGSRIYDLTGETIETVRDSDDA